METDVLQELGMSTRDEAVLFLKKLWAEQPAACPKCGGSLNFLHKKAKKSIAIGNARNATQFIEPLIC